MADVTNTATTERVSPMWVRILEIILGLIAIVLGAYVLIYPGIAVETLIIILAIALIVIAIRDFVTVFSRGIPGWQRVLSLILALIALGIAAYVLAFPIGGALTLAFLLGLALIFAGISAAARGTGGSAAVGIIAIILGFAVVIFPGLGIGILIILLAVALVILGLEAIAGGITGKTRWF